MTKLEMRAFLTEASALTGWEVTDALVAAWHLAIGDLDLDQARQAFYEHVRTSAVYPKPAHVWALAGSGERPEPNATRERLERAQGRALTVQEATSEIVHEAKFGRGIHL